MKLAGQFAVATACSVAAVAIAWFVLRPPSVKEYLVISSRWIPIAMLAVLALIMLIATGSALVAAIIESIGEGKRRTPAEPEGPGCRSQARHSAAQRSATDKVSVHGRDTTPG